MPVHDPSDSCGAAKAEAAFLCRSIVAEADEWADIGLSGGGLSRSWIELLGFLLSSALTLCVMS